MRTWQLLHEGMPETIEDVRQILLKNRNIEDISSFIDVKPPQDISLTEAGLNSAQMKKAVERILAAGKNGEKVIIFGDYDADGICATAILWLTLFQLKIEAKPFIPHRLKHGYGISDIAIDEILGGDEKPSLIITVDNGIVAHGPLKRLKEKEGIDVIVTDHHQPEFKEGKIMLPPAYAVVHSPDLCGATVSWMLSRELDSKAASKHMDLAGIATIADQVPLLGANRSFAKYGIIELQNTSKVGLKQLFKAAGIDNTKISSSTIGYAIAPRINAMGRLKHGLDALRLLCTRNESKAAALVKTMMETNIERQDLTNELLENAVIQAEEQKDEHIIIVSSDEYHDGVIGLIAGRLMEKYYKPAVALSIDGGIAKASARSVAGVNIVELLRLVQDDLIDVGGHPLAAGFILEADKVAKVKEKLIKYSKEKISNDLLVPVIKIDTVIPWKLVGHELVSMTDELAPFGQANNQPLFQLNDVKVLTVMTMGKERAHLKLVVGFPQTDDAADTVKSLNIISWRNGPLAANIHEGDTISVIGTLEFNHWNGRTSIQMLMKEIRF